MSRSNAATDFPSPLVGEGFPPRSCGAARKLHGGKGEGVILSRRGFAAYPSPTAPKRGRALPQGESGEIVAMPHQTH